MFGRLNVADIICILDEQNWNSQAIEPLLVDATETGEHVDMRVIVTNDC